MRALAKRHVHIRGDARDGRTILALNATGRTYHTAYVVVLSVQEYISVDGEVFHHALAHLTKEAQGTTLRIDVEATDSLAITIKCASEALRGSAS